MEIKLTSSIIEAIQCVLRLAYGNLYVYLDGRGETMQGTSVPSPSWCNFDFFSRIVASDVRRTKRVEPTGEHLGYWRLERTVEFFLQGTHVATVTLVGQKTDGCSRDKLDNGSFWGVKQIGYFRVFGGGKLVPPQDWRDLHLDVTGLTARLVE